MLNYTLMPVYFYSLNNYIKVGIQFVRFNSKAFCGPERLENKLCWPEELKKKCIMYISMLSYNK